MMRDFYELGQAHWSTGDVNWWVIGPALIAFVLMLIEHTSSGRSW